MLRACPVRRVGAASHRNTAALGPGEPVETGAITGCFSPDGGREGRVRAGMVGADEQAGPLQPHGYAGPRAGSAACRVPPVPVSVSDRRWTVM